MNTQTDKGLIPHARHPEHGFMMPVMLKRKCHESGGYTLVTNANGLPTPEGKYGKLHYALPGGGFIAL